jgi:hypothetical protein
MLNIRSFFFAEIILLYNNANNNCNNMSHIENECNLYLL